MVGVVRVPEPLGEEGVMLVGWECGGGVGCCRWIDFGEFLG